MCIYVAGGDCMPLLRDASKRMEAWRQQPNHRALLVDGARQVGKTFTVREFARRHYESFLEINFIETPSAMAIFDGDLDARSLITNLTAFSGAPLTPGKSLIFLDEIQECPRARTAIKFLVDDGRFDYVESGSLLGVKTKQVPSYPVGYESSLRMAPLSLPEFFRALGIQDEVLGAAREAVAHETPVSAAIHERLLRLFRIYLAIGGMPAAVQSFVETSDVAKAANVQRDILALYRQDVVKYASNPTHVRGIFDAIPSELDKKNKRFRLRSVGKSARMERYENDFLWIADAGCGLPCYNVEAPVKPLALNKKHSVFKLYSNDVGLLTASEDEPVQFELINGDAGINWGSVLENAVAEELASKGYQLRYFDRSRVGEVDFLITTPQGVLPIEVKSGRDYRRHRALDNLMDVREWGLEEAIVLCQGNVERDGKTLYLPWYALAFLPDHKPDGSMIVAW